MLEHLNKHRNRNKYRKGITVCIACLTAIIVLLATVFQGFLPTVISQKTKEPKVPISGSYDADALNLDDAPAYRTDAKFKILEIVPYRGMAELGYGIAGEEPVDIRRISEQDARGDLAQILHNTDSVLKWDSTRKQLMNQNAFVKTTLKEALQLSDKQTQEYITNKWVDVLVVEPAQLNANPALIQESDYIYLHDDFAKGNNDYFNRLLMLYEKYSYRALKGTLTKKYYNSGNYPVFKAGSNSTDLSMNVVEKLYTFALIDEKSLTIPGYTLKGEMEGHTNIQKLGYAVSVTAYLQNEKYINATKAHDKLFVDSHKTSWNDFWNIKELVHYLTPGKSSEWDALVARVENGYSDSVNNDFVGNYYDTTVCAFAHGAGEQSSLLSKIALSDSFGSKIHASGDEKWCENVGNDSRDVAITIYNQYCPELRVLDVEPDNKFTLDKMDVKTWLPADIRLKIHVVKMTMSEFIGIVDDLNSEYDMIYFGSNVDKMMGMNIYYTGIQVDTDDSFSFAQGTGVNGDSFQYSGNDITDRMVDKVKAFMDAGYPVAYASNLLDSGKLSHGIKIYDFLCSEKAGKDRMFSVSDKFAIQDSKGNKLLSRANVLLGKPQIWDTDPKGVQEYYEGASSSIGAGGLAGFEINVRHASGSYGAYLYVDGDHNGIYNEWEQKSGKYDLNKNYEDYIWHVTFTAGNTVTVSGATIPKNAMKGVVSVKLEIVKLDDGKPTGIRSCKTWNLKCSGSQEQIKVLQLSDLAKYPSMDLSSSSAQANQFKKFALSGVVTDRFKIDVDTKDIMTTDFKDPDVLDMDDYDVILVGFIDPNKKLTDPDGLLNKLAIAAGKGKGIIFTQDALTYYNDTADAGHWGTNMNYKVRSLLGLDRYMAFKDGAAVADSMEMAFTYSAISKFSSSKYFNGLSSDIESTNTISRINEAKVARYPYVIEIDAAKKTKGFHAKSGIYQTDVEQKGVPAVNGVAYFCLDGDGSSNHYSVSPRDVRNNYYLWRNDSVFYSGISAESFNGSYDNEVKLFVNTIISAYGLVRSVDLNVTNLHEVNDFAGGKAYILYGDVDFKADKVLGKKDVEFNLTTSGMSSPALKLSFYSADGDGNIVSGPLEIYKNNKRFQDDDSAPEEKEFSVSTGVDYIYEYPYKYLNEGTNVNIIMKVTATEKGRTVTDSVLIKALRRSMFDLD